MNKTHRLSVAADGTVQFVYSDELKPLAAALGTPETKRASHVEPDGDEWFVDLSPSGGPKVTGFATRAAALGYEVDWLNKNLIR